MRVKVVIVSSLLAIVVLHPELGARDGRALSAITAYLELPPGALVLRPATVRVRLRAGSGPVEAPARLSLRVDGPASFGSSATRVKSAS